MLGFITVTKEAIENFLNNGVPGVLAFVVLILVILVFRMILRRDQLTDRVILLAEKQAEASTKTQATMECQCRLMEKHNELTDKLVGVISKCKDILDPD